MAVAKFYQPQEQKIPTLIATHKFIFDVGCGSPLSLSVSVGLGLSLSLSVGLGLGLGLGFVRFRLESKI